MRAVRMRWAVVATAAACVAAGGAALVVHTTSAGAAASAAGSFTSLPPTRVLDTRTGLGAVKHSVAANGTLVLQIGGRGGVPSSGVGAVALNVVVTAPTAAGYITVWGGGTRPATATLNFVRAQTVPNLAVTPMDAGGKVRIYNASSGTVQLVADVSGYYRSGTATMVGMFTPLPPTRVLDTRSGTGAPKSAVGANQELKVSVDGGHGVPATGVSAVLLDVAAVGATAGGYLTVWGDGPRPSASNLHFDAGPTVRNLVLAPVDSGGRVHFYNASSRGVHLIADVSGYYLAGGPLHAGGLNPIPATRLVDTRISGKPIAALSTRTLPVAGHAWVLPSGVSAVVLHVNAAAATSSGHLTVWGGGTRPATSNVNFVRGQTTANLVVTPVSPTGLVSFYNASAGTVHLVVDIAGYLLGADRTPAPPGQATGRYVRNLADGGSPSDATTMHTEGCDDATAATGAGPYLHLLHIGAQSQHDPLSVQNPGVALTGFAEDSTPRLTYAELVTALDAYLDGYVECHTGSAQATVAIGTNNDGDWTGYTATAKGTDWATQVIEPLRTHVTSSWLHVAGADDIEAGFSSSETDAENWVTAFLGKTPAGLVQDGSLDNCPLPFQTGGPVSCGPVTDDNGVTKTWTQAQYLRLEHGLAPGRITPLPQIYIPLQAWQWANLVAAGNGQLTIPAVLTENAAEGSEFTPAQAWGAIWDALSTRANASAPTMSVDLRSDWPATLAPRRNARATLPRG